MKTKKLRRDRERACGEPESTQDSDNCPDIGKHDYFYPETETQHSPTPWHVGKTLVSAKDPVFFHTAIVNDSDTIRLANVGGIGEGESKANAAFIVRAVNAHEELLNALSHLKMLVAGIENGAVIPKSGAAVVVTKEVIEKCKQAIARGEII